MSRPDLSGSRGPILSITSFVLAANLFLTAGWSSIAQAEWKTWGVELCTAFDQQNFPNLVSDGAGGAIVAWMDRRTGETDVYAQRISHDGTPLWTHDGVAVCTATGQQRFPMLVADGAGGAIITWKDERSGGADIYSQRIDSNGLPLWTSQGVPVCTQSYDQTDPEIVSDGAQGAIIVWRDWRNGATPRLYAQKLNGSGVKQWTSNGVSVTTTANDYSCTVLPDGAGGALVGWFAWRNSQYDIFAQHLTAQGTTAWPQPGAVICAAAGYQMYPKMTSDEAGGAIVAWWDYRNGFSDIYAQRFTSSGSLAPGWPLNGVAVCAAPNDQSEPVLVPDGNHGAIITWYDNRSIVAVYAQHVNGTGGITTGWPVDGRKLCVSPATRPTIMPDGDGGALVAWHGTPGNTNFDVSVQHVNAAGEIPGGWPSDGIYLCTAPGDQSRPVGIPLPGGDALIAWSDGRSADGGDIYVSRVTVAFPNLSADITPSGFEYPIVPRNAPGAPTDIALTPVLDGDSPTTLLNWAVTRDGSGTLPAWNCRIALDGQPLRTTTVSETSSDGIYSVVNDGPVEVPGGRHTLALEVDWDNAVSESSEADNTWVGQFVWSPRPLTARVPRLHAAPPERGSGFLPNLDGFQFSPSPGTAWVCALAPVDGRDNYDLALFDDYAGSLSGYTHRIGASSGSGGATDFLVGQGAGTPATVYPAALRTSTGPASEYLVDQSDATGRLGSADITQWVEQVMAAHRLVDVYEADFTAGQVYYVNVIQKWGSSDMGFSIFPAGMGRVFGPGDALASSLNLTTDGHAVDVARFTPPVTGRYPIVVYRRDGGQGIDEPLTYEIFWSNVVSGVDDGAGAAVLSFYGASPNPTSGPTELSFTVPLDGTARLALFDVTGRLVRPLVDGPVSAGSHQVAWDGRSQDGSRARGGVYWARLETGGRAITRRIVVTP